MSESSARTHHEFTRFLKFSVVGVIGAVVDFGTFNLLTTVLNLPSILSSVLSFSAAVTSNFLWNRYWTYPDSRSKRVHQQALQFGVVSIIGLAIRTPIFAFSEQPFIEASTKMLPGLSEAAIPWISRMDPATLGSNLALALAVIVVLFWNFGANRLWTYSDAD